MSELETSQLIGEVYCWLFLFCQEGQTALMMALTNAWFTQAGTDNFEIVELLLKAETTDVNIRNNVSAHVGGVKQAAYLLNLHDLL